MSAKAKVLRYVLIIFLLVLLFPILRLHILAVAPGLYVRQTFGEKSDNPFSDARLTIIAALNLDLVSLDPGGVSALVNAAHFNNKDGVDFLLDAYSCAQIKQSYRVANREKIHGSLVSEIKKAASACVSSMGPRDVYRDTERWKRTN